MSLEFSYSFGFTNVQNSVAFYDENTVIFGAGKQCILLDLDSKYQRCFQFAERAEVSAIVRCDIRIAAAMRSHPSSVCLFNTLSESKKFYIGPTSMESQEFTCVSVSTNVKFLAAQSGPPDWTLVIWLTQSREIFAVYSPVGNSEASVHDISFNASGSDELIVVGDGVFKLYEYQEENEEDSPFTEHIFEKFEKSGKFDGICWPQKENLAVGSSEGEILFFRGLELINEISVIDDVKNLQELGLFDSEQNETSKSVTSIVATTEHLLCLFGEFVVLVYEGEEITEYKLSKYIFLQAEKYTPNIPGELKGNKDRFTKIVVSPECKDLIGTTRNGQLLRCYGFHDGAEQQQFTSLLQQQHNEPIIGIDVAQSRPLIASCSLHVAILWNYSDKKQEVRKLFRDEISSIAIHPTGLFVALGHNYFCRIFSILYNGLRERQLISCKNCLGVTFSSGGHCFAIVSGSIIEIYSFISFALLFKLDGHAGSVTGLDWKDNDSKLVSCDYRGVICEWDLVSPGKIWENTAVRSYLSVAINSLTGTSVAVGSDSSVRCIRDAFIQWDLKTNKEPTSVVIHSNKNVFFVGTTEGSLISYTFPLSDESNSVYAHSGEISAIKLNFTQDFLISAGNDNSVLIWKISEKYNQGLFSNLALVDNSNIQEQRDKSEQLLLSLQHNNTSSDCNFELNCVKHEEMLRKMALYHEHTIHDLNYKIAVIKQEIQTALFDSDPNIYLKELEIFVRQEIIDTTVNLDEAYKRSNACVKETEKIVLNYENIMDSLTEEQALFSSTERNAMEEMEEQIKGLENNVIEEKIRNQALLMNDEAKSKIEEDVFDRRGKLKSSQAHLLGNEKLKSTHLTIEIEKLSQLTAFQTEDTRKRRNITAGQVDYDIKEKIRTGALLKEDFQRFKGVLEAKEKLVQIQERKFCEMRKSVGQLEKRYSVSKIAIEELMGHINSKGSAIESCQREIKKVTDLIPLLEEEVQLTEDLCSTITLKVGETFDAYQKKQKTLRELQDVTIKYTSMLHQCFDRKCDLMKLVNDIMRLFDDSKIGLADETGDSSLQEEYDFQIEKLKKSYDLIKVEPAKAVRNKSMAEFRLSQENFKILHEVHDIQKDAEKFRDVINKMEVALGMPTTQTKSNKLADDLRYKIEFVVAASRNNRENRVCEIQKLDKFIEEQQKEIERFQKMLPVKLKKS